ncbi:MAG: hypothetical protein S4CHLAM2_14090 [Chlamydiales bacterium]|nr:hypothetical protein [Chlamydiales bacterium]
MHTIALFGEAQKGEFETAYHCKNLAQLSDFLGEPPTEESLGLRFAVQALLFERGVVFFRVKEEGFSTPDYLFGLNFLENKNLFPTISGLCLPGVGCSEIIHATEPVCEMHRSILMVTERDLYDYLTNR